MIVPSYSVVETLSENQIQSRGLDHTVSAPGQYYIQLPDSAREWTAISWPLPFCSLED